MYVSLCFCLILYYSVCGGERADWPAKWVMPIVSVSQCAGGHVLACPAVPYTTIQANRHACCNVGWAIGSEEVCVSKLLRVAMCTATCYVSHHAWLWCKQWPEQCPVLSYSP